MKNLATYIDKSAVMWGDVSLGKGSSVWPQAVLRGDLDAISIGENSNIQDNVTVHVSKNYGVEIGRGVSIGHNAVIHGCTIKDHCLIGMGATIMNGVVIEEGCIIAAGALVTEGKVIPPNSLVVGVPGRVVRTLREEEKEKIKKNARAYAGLAETYRKKLIR